MAFGMVGLSLVLLTGYSGQVSLCQFSFMGIGAFLMGKVAGGGSLLGLVAAAGVCAVLGALIALPTIRLRDLYFALATFAFADAVDQGVLRGHPRLSATGAPMGRIVLPGLSFGATSRSSSSSPWCSSSAPWLVLAIRRSLFGRRLVAMNDSPAAYATVGLNLGLHQGGRLRHRRRHGRPGRRTLRHRQRHGQRGPTSPSSPASSSCCSSPSGACAR